MNIKNIIAGFALLSCILVGCETEDPAPPEEPTGSFSGALDSIAGVGGDSGAIATPANSQTFVRFSYDAQRRVTKMSVSNKAYFFGYEGSSTNPSVMTDSTPPTSGDYATIIKTNFIYNTSGQLIKDTVTLYYRRHKVTNEVEYSTPILKKNEYSYSGNAHSRMRNGSSYQPDVTYFDNNGNISNCAWYGSGYELDTFKLHHNVLNPLNQLNIKSAFAYQQGDPFFKLNFFPINIDLFQSKYLFKSFVGRNFLYYRTQPNEICYVDCSYRTDSNGKIDMIIYSAINYSSATGLPLGGRGHMNIKFYYHP